MAMSIIEVIMQMFDEHSLLETSAVAVGSSLTAIFYFVHRKFNKKARFVEDAPFLEINHNLTELVREAPFSSLPYVAVSGCVDSMSAPLTCQYNSDITGVIWNRTTIEHKEVWQKLFNDWHSEERKISSVGENVPFKLCGKMLFTGTSAAVEVMDPSKSSWFDETIDVVHEHFTPAESSVVDSVMSYVRGDRLKGFTDRERMLKVGTKLYAIGELLLKDDGELQIRSPRNSSSEFIISKKSPVEIVAEFRRSATTWKIFALLMGGATITAGYFLTRRLLAKWAVIKERRRRDADADEIRRQRLQRVANNRGNVNRPSLDESDPCVVCLTNPRECVLLNCGHVCLCADCLQLLPQPIRCPVCREQVSRTIPLFHA